MLSDAHLRVRDAAPLEQYDLVIVALGYEGRCTHIASVLDGRSEARLASAFDGEDSHDFRKNREVLEGLNFECVVHREGELGGWIRRELGSATDKLALALDTSSFSRSRLADALLALREVGRTRPLEIDFWYSPAKFDETVDRTPAIEVAEPIAPEFAGWSADPNLPVTAVIGIGYERNLALGVCEYLDVSKVYAYEATGHDEQFDRLTNEANISLFTGRDVARRTTYDLLRPFDLFARLESLVYGLSRNQRVSVIPLGPKPFALCSMLVAMNSKEPVTVWRFSGGPHAEPRPSEACDKSTSLRVTFSPVIVDQQFSDEV